MRTKEYYKEFEWLDDIYTTNFKDIPRVLINKRDFPIIPGDTPLYVAELIPIIRNPGSINRIDSWIIDYTRERIVVEIPIFDEDKKLIEFKNISNKPRPPWTKVIYYDVNDQNLFLRRLIYNAG